MIHKNRFTAGGQVGRSTFIGLSVAAALFQGTGEWVPRSRAAEPPREDSAKTAEANSTNSLLRPVGPGVFEIGKVRLDKEHNSVSFPAELNMDSGPIEYLLVNSNGKRHESILVTEAEPFHIQAALLLLGARGSSMFPNAVPKAPASTDASVAGQETDGSIRKPSAVNLPGDRVRIELSWKAGPKEFRRDAESLFLNQESRTGATQAGKWIYNGSRVQNGLFFAQVTGSVVSLITDQDALINSEVPGHENDDVWAVNTNNIPPFKTPVQVTIIVPKNGVKK